MAEGAPHLRPRFVASVNWRTRELITETIPAPLRVTDQIPSVTIPRWHRGTQRAVDGAPSFYGEVKDLVERGMEACENERVWLMWLGTGLWFNLGFYQHFERHYGAVFVWSVYLDLAADAMPMLATEASRSARYPAAWCAWRTHCTCLPGTRGGT